ncbi:MAG: DUF2497 domain-containing protein [Hyphomicrobiales bacterium]
MTASAQRAAEPSMEEILASIRRIIADDQSRARLGSAKLVSVAGSSPGNGLVSVAPRADPPRAEPPVEQKHVSEAAPSLEDASTDAAKGPSGDLDHPPDGGTSVAPPDICPAAPAGPDAQAHLPRESEPQPAPQPARFSTAPEEHRYFPPEAVFVSGRASVPASLEPPPVQKPDFLSEADKLTRAGSAELEDDAQPPSEARNSVSPTPEARVRSQPATPELGAAPAIVQRPPEPDQERAGAKFDEARIPVAAPRREARSREPGAILSSEADTAIARAFNSLSRTVLSDNARTLEDLVKEMLRPLLKAWLDDNLPPLVERLVRMEIERVARGRPD